MRSNPMNSGPGYDVGIDYNESTGAINGVWCDNTGPYVIDCTATLTTGQAFMHTFDVGVGQLLPISGSLVTVSMGGDGELVFDGLASTSVTPHLP
jgi:hypothetical protein